MSKNRMEALLQVLADYNAFCNASKSAPSQATTYSCELSENELELIAAAAYVPQQKSNKSDNA